MKRILYACISLLMVINSGCKRSEFLDKKPLTNIVTPKGLKDFQGILDNTTIMTNTGIAFAQMAADEYVLSYTDWQALKAIPRNSYIWASDIYQGEKGTFEWDWAYTQVFYANSVLDGLKQSDSAGTSTGQYLKGWALFARAYAMYDLTRTYCKAYDLSTAGTDLGIPLRLKSGIDYIAQRSTLQQSFEQILEDLVTAQDLLPASRPSANLNRPSKIAAYALLARIYLDMRDYSKAELYADQSLALYDVLIDYNTISKTAAAPFSATHDELIYNSAQVIAYPETTGSGTTAVAKINPELISLYHPEDLRLPIYFSRLSDGTYSKKRGYRGSGLYPFTGLATDEVYLIKAECLARRNQSGPAMDKLNQLLIKRFPNPGSYVPLTVSSADAALDAVLLERRKELVWRSLRWYDLKRLNREGANISLTRTLNGMTYTLPPNDNRWVFPIYADEIALSNIQQNIR